ncbi:hypothetical protein AMAG_04609 [Allomyces macrogynus ATCC 38327]|uniref:G-protein coupled receptors family 3 profile domain-containing protein n=1 Tax=Allomyces macrogynus (strain ATCC 38327) TaxID=578462 RepID=A0A0L0S5E0_ALLM3|nr:hypothetical protein AMAG_04609 [Allomyces macrogynus ATCC 38327]|eukprot:KNE57753.1 hypothetical protein AMAG_04609 [Allomyces macrogynus ATCC 38327]
MITLARVALLVLLVAALAAPPTHANDPNTVHHVARAGSPVPVTSTSVPAVQHGARLLDPAPAPPLPEFPVSADAHSASSLIKIGVLLPLSSPDATYRNMSIAALNAIRLAVQRFQMDRTEEPLRASMRKADAAIQLVVADEYAPDRLDLGRVNTSMKVRIGETEVVPETWVAQAILSTMDLIVNQKVAAVVGEMTSPVTRNQALITSRFEILQCSFSASHPDLSNKKMYPYFLRAIGSAKLYAEAVVSLIHRLGVSHYTILTSTDDFSTEYTRTMENVKDIGAGPDRTLPTINRRFWFTSNKVRDNIDETLNKLTADATVPRTVFVSAIDQPQLALITKLKNRGLFNKEWTWILLNNITDAFISVYENPAKITGKDSPLLGVFMVTPQSGNTTIYFDEFATALARATGQELWYNEPQAYTCAGVLLRALLRYVDGDANVAKELAQGRFPKGPITLQAVNQTNWHSPIGLARFDAEGSIFAGADVLNWRPVTDNPKDNTTTGAVLVLRKPYAGALMGLPPGGSLGPMLPDGSQPVNDYDGSLRDITISIASGSLIATFLLVLISIGTLSATTILGIIFIWRSAPEVRAISPVFCYQILLGIIFMYVSLTLEVLPRPSGPSGDFYCNVSAVTGVLAVGLVVGNIVAKNHRIWQLFGSPFLFRQGLPDSKILQISVVLVAMDVALAASWVFESPFRIIHVKDDAANVKYDMCIAGLRSDVTAITSAAEIPSMYENWVFWAICVYNFGLIVYGCVLAWKTRRIPVAGYSESGAIAISVYNIALGGTILLPTYFSPLNRMYFVSFSLQLLIIYFCTTFAMLAFFVPPLYSLWLRRAQADLGDLNLIQADLFKNPTMRTTTGGAATASSGNHGSTSASAVGSRSSMLWPSLDRTQVDFGGGVAANETRYNPFQPVQPTTTTTSSTGAAGPESGEVRRLSIRQRRGVRTIPRPITTTSSVLTTWPDASAEAVTGTLIVKKSHRLGAWLGRLVAFWDRWQVVNVVIVPHQRLLVLRPVNPEDARAVPTYDTFTFQAVFGPDDVARRRCRVKQNVLATHILPERTWYAPRRAGSGKSTTSSPQTPANVVAARSKSEINTRMSAGQAIELSPVVPSPPPPTYRKNSLRSPHGTATTAGTPVRCDCVSRTPADPKMAADTNAPVVVVDWRQFEVLSAYHNYVFQTETEEQTELWVKVLRQALAGVPDPSAGRRPVSLATPATGTTPRTGESRESLPMREL